jgi:hypothetical protein
MLSFLTTLFWVVVVLIAISLTLQAIARVPGLIWVVFGVGFLWLTS